MSDYLDLEQRMRIGGLQTAMERYRTAVRIDIEQMTEGTLNAVIAARENYTALKASYNLDYPEKP